MYSNAIIFKKLFNIFSVSNTVKKIKKDSITNEETEVMEPGPYFLSFLPNSIALTNEDFNFLDTNLPANLLADSYENQMTFSYFTNVIIRNSKIHNPFNQDFLQDSYKKIFDNALLIDSSISDTDKQVYKEARDILFLNEDMDPTPGYSKYLTYEEKYKVISDQIINAANSSQRQSLQTKRDIIFNDWLIDGNKEIIEKALKTVHNLNPRAAFVSKWMSESAMLQENMQNITTVNSMIEFLPVSCIPNNLYEYGYPGWVKIVLEEAEINSLEEEAKNYFGESFYNASDDGNQNICKIEFEYLFVSLLRNWFKSDLINSRFWSFAADNPNTVSDEKDLNKGLLPSYIEKFIFIRRVCTYNKIISTPDKTLRVTLGSPVSLNKLMTYSFKDFKTVKKVNEIGTITPKEATGEKYKLLTSEHNVIKPIIMKSASSDRRLMLTKTTSGISDGPERSITTSREASVKPMTKPVLGSVRFWPFNPRGNAQPAAPPKTNFNLTLIFKDNIGNLIDGIEASITNKTDGSNYSQETGNDGKVILPNLIKGDYRVEVKEEEIYEDTDIYLSLEQDTEKTIILQKRPYPRFNMFLIGAINYHFPKLPDPLTEYTYSKI